MKTGNILLVISLTLGVFASNALATGIESPQSIHEAAKNFLLDELSGQDVNDDEISLYPLDKRLRLTRCDQPLKAFFPSKQNLLGRVTVGVRCDGAKSWKIFVSANISRYEIAFIANKNLDPADTISEEDIDQIQVDLAKMRYAPVQSKAQLLGTKPKRYMRAGQIFKENSVCFVCRGDTVTLKAEMTGLQVSTKAVALEDAFHGDWIEVRNIKTMKTIQAKVIGRNELQVLL